MGFTQKGFFFHVITTYLIPAAIPQFHGSANLLGFMDYEGILPYNFY